MSKPLRPDDSAFFQRLMSLRQEKETISEFAKRCGVTPGTLQATRRNSNPYLLTVLRIAKSLGVNPVWLIFGKRDAQNETGNSTNAP